MSTVDDNHQGTKTAPLQIYGVLQYQTLCSTFSEKEITDAVKTTVQYNKQTNRSTVQGITGIHAHGIGTLLSALEVNWTICGGVTAEKQFPRFHTTDLNFDHSSLNNQHAARQQKDCRGTVWCFT